MAVVLQVVTPDVAIGTEYPMPSIQDEKDTYTNVLGWSYTSPQLPTNISEPISPYVISSVDIHGVPEADDLWNYYQMYRRGGGALYSNRANAWATYFKSSTFLNTDLNADVQSFGGDHMVGWGLLLKYQTDGDAASLARAIEIGAVIENLWNVATTPYACVANNGCIGHGIRLVSRHLRMASRLYQSTGNTRWLTLTNTIKTMFLGTSYWDATYKMYFEAEADTDDYLTNSLNSPAGEYSTQGTRLMSTFQIGIAAEAFWACYWATSDAACRQRIIDMADFVMTYGLDPEYDYACNTVGIRNGKIWGDYTHYEIINKTGTGVSTIKVRSDGADTRQVTLFGKNSSDVSISETLTLNGTSDVTSVNSYRRFHRATVNTSSGTRTISFRDSAGAVLITNNSNAPFVIDTGTTSAIMVPLWNPLYTSSLVNLCVMAYKFTGTTAYLTKAQHIFLRGTKGLYPSSTSREAADNVVGHFMDTRFESSTSNYFLYDNKGDLQYTYLLFENGGVPTVIGNTHLDSVISATSTGAFGLLNQNGDGSGYTTSLMFTGGAAVGGIISFTDKGVYDSQTGTLYIAAGEHEGEFRLIKYVIATNTWSYTVPPWSDIRSANHAYNSNAIDVTRRRLYCKRHGSLGSLFRLNLNTGVWSAMADLPSTTSSLDSFFTPTLEFFPDRDKLVAFWGHGVFEYNDAANTWTQIYAAFSFSGMGDSADSIYDPVNQCIWIAGGDDRSVWKYSSAGVITQKADFPSNALIHGAEQGMLAFDASTGKVILFSDNNAGEWLIYRYNAAGDTWTRLDSQGAGGIVVPNGWTLTAHGVNGVASISLPSPYNCILYFSCNSGDLSKAYILKQ